MCVHMAMMCNLLVFVSGGRARGEEGMAARVRERGRERVMGVRIKLKSDELGSSSEKAY